MKQRYRFAAAIPCGVITAFSLPPWGLWPIAIIGLGIFLKLLDVSSWKNRLATAVSIALLSTFKFLFRSTKSLCRRILMASNTQHCMASNPNLGGMAAETELILWFASMKTAKTRKFLIKFY